MATMTESIDSLLAQVRALEVANKELREELEYLKTHPTIAAGLRGERLVLSQLGGRLTEYAASYDLELSNGTRIEIKYSRLNTPELNAPDTHRWSWSKVLGFRDKGKDYAYLLLIGEKDKRHKEQYLGDAPYVYFLIPRDRVSEIVVKGKLIGSNTNLTTNFRTVRSIPSKVIIAHMVPPDLVHALEHASTLNAS